jgi:hypothetical protein
LQVVGLAQPRAAAEGSWIDLERASLLLLIRPLLAMPWRLEWRHDPLALQSLLYGLACEIQNQFDPRVPRLDRSAAALAGIFGDAVLTPMRRFFGASDRAPLLRTIASELIAKFTAMLPGFRKAEQAAIVRQFLCTPGRIRVDDESVLVVIEPNPWFAAVRIASLDHPIEAVPWFEDRRVEFRIEGL